MIEVAEAYDLRTDAPVVEERDDDISKTLKDVGVTYTHKNESLIANNAIEGERIKALMEVDFYPDTRSIIIERVYSE